MQSRFEPRKTFAFSRRNCWSLAPKSDFSDILAAEASITRSKNTQQSFKHQTLKNGARKHLAMLLGVPATLSHLVSPEALRVHFRALLRPCGGTAIFQNFAVQYCYFPNFFLLYDTKLYSFKNWKTKSQEDSTKQSSSIYIYIIYILLSIINIYT